MPRFLKGLLTLFATKKRRSSPFSKEPEMSSDDHDEVDPSEIQNIHMNDLISPDFSGHAPVAMATEMNPSSPELNDLDRPFVSPAASQPFSPHETNLAASLVESAKLHLIHFPELYFEQTTPLFVYSAHNFGEIFRQHAIPFDGPASLRSRHRLSVHLLNGMCASGNGPVCEPLHAFPMITIFHELKLIVHERVQANKIRDFSIREMCRAIDVKSDKSMPLVLSTLPFRCGLCGTCAALRELLSVKACVVRLGQ